MLIAVIILSVAWSAHAADSDCGQEYSATSDWSTFTSPNYPSNYPHNIYGCVTTLFASEGEQIELSFQTFQVESGWNGGCDDYDFIEIRDGDSSSSNLLGNFCGTDSPGDITSSGNALWIEFNSDGSTSKSGFSANFRAIGDAVSSVERYECHHWTDDDEDWRDANDASDERMCERNEGYVYTRGDETLAPGCGGCWCCKPDNSYSFSLINREGEPSDNGAGLLIVTWPNVTGTVCDDYFSDMAASAICNEMGYNTSAGSWEYGNLWDSLQDSYDIALDNVRCSTNNFAECTYRRYENCGHDEDVFLTCTDTDTILYSIEEFAGNANPGTWQKYNITSPIGIGTKLRLNVVYAGTTVSDINFRLYKNYPEQQGALHFRINTYGSSEQLRFNQQRYSDGTLTWVGPWTTPLPTLLTGDNAVEITIEEESFQVSFNGEQVELAEVMPVYSEDLEGIEEVWLYVKDENTWFGDDNTILSPIDNADTDSYSFSLINSAGRPSGNGTGLLIVTWSDNVVGTVCDDYFSDKSASAICNEMGYDTSASSWESSSKWYSLQTSYVTALDDVVCSTYNFAECSYSRSENCGHSEDVFLTCTDTDTSPTVSPTTSPVDGHHNEDGGENGGDYHYDQDCEWDEDWGAYRCYHGGARGITAALTLLITATIYVLI